MLAAFIASLAVSYMVEGKQRRYLKNAFKQYLSPAVIEQLIANPSQLKLGGERKELSAEQMNRILNAINNEEKKTQEKLNANKVKGKAKKSNTKDW